MPRMQAPLTFQCNECGWKKTLASPVSDVRIPGLNHVDRCEKCGCQNLQSRQATVLELAKARVGSLLGQR